MKDIQTFEFAFTVRAPLSAVAAFHNDAQALPRLTPPPIVVQLHRVEPLAEDSLAEFTLWFGFLPVHWVAVHSAVHSRQGFTDTQRSGPMQYWRHTHRFETLEAGATRVTETIDYAHHQGWRGWLSRLLFNPLALRLLFFYRSLVTRRALEGQTRA